MKSTPEAITLEEASAILGGTQPIPIDHIRQMIRGGWLKSYGTRANRRVFRAECYDILADLASGGLTCPATTRRKPAMTRGAKRSMNTRKAEASDSPPSKLTAKSYIGVVPRARLRRTT